MSLNDACRLWHETAGNIALNDDSHRLFEIKRFVRSDLEDINEFGDVSPMALEFNGNKRLPFND
jgi:hypothetical protein